MPHDTEPKRQWPGLVRKVLHRHIPILTWMPKYNLETVMCDLIAGVTVGLTVMPQGLAYATLAGLEPQYGLYAAFMGCFVYIIFGSCKDITIGPTALMSLMTYQQVVGRNSDFAVLLCFLSGCVQLLMSVLHLGVLVDFISIPVTVGFTSATSVIIACSQLKGLLGLKISASGFIETITKVSKHIGETRLGDTVLSSVCIVVLLLLRKLKDVKLGNGENKPTKQQRVIMKLLWLLSTSRNALVVVTCSIIAFVLYNPEREQQVFLLTGEVRSGLPEFSLPPFTTTLGNKTLSFSDMCSELGSSIVLVPIIAVLGNVAIAKAFASGDSIDATQELLTLGLCNILASFLSSLPITGSFSRSAVNHASGVRTPFGGLYTGLLIILALSVLTPYFYFIPKASLAAVIICAVIFMIEYEVVKPMWRSNRKDLIPTFATFVLCLLIGVEYGILVGVAINMIFLLYPSARPTIHVERKKTCTGRDYIMVTPANNLYFPAVDFIRTSVSRVGVKDGGSQLPVIVDCRFILGADFTAAKGIAALIDDFHKRKQAIYFYNPHESVISVFKGASLEDFVHICGQEELELILQAHMELQEEGDKCMADATKLSMVELKEVTSTPSGSSHHTRRDDGGHGEHCTCTPLLGGSAAPRTELRRI